MTPSRISNPKPDDVTWFFDPQVISLPLTISILTSHFT
jgi:hypothetical protein